MSVNVLNRAKIRAPLLGWLRTKLNADVDLISLYAVGDGASSETWFVETQTCGNASARWVVRVEASQHQIYQDPSIKRQVHMMETLGRVSDVPVPRVFWFETDPTVLGAPFYVMEHVEGNVPPQALHNEGVFFDAQPAVRRAMWLSGIEALTRIHRLDAKDFPFLARNTHGANPLQQELSVWDEYQIWSLIPSYEVLDRARLWLDDNMPQDQAGGVAWGDARLGNIIFRNNICVSILDWETANLAGPESDLAWWLVFDKTVTRRAGDAGLEGIGDRSETIAVWEHYMGRKANALEWHEVFSAWRIAMIVERAVTLASGRAVIAGAGAENRTISYLRELIA